MNTRGLILIVGGIAFLINAAIQAHKAPNISYLIGTFLPGMALLIWGLKRRQAAAAQNAADEESQRSETR